MMTEQHKSRRVWAWVGGIAAAAVISSILTAVLVIAGHSTGAAPARPGSSSVTPQPTASTEPSSVADASGAGASGCTAVPISVRSVLALRTSRDFTPKGAAEFAGAVVQLVGLTPMDADLPQFQQQATTGNASDQVAKIVGRGGMADAAGSASLWGGSYIVESHTPEQTTVLLMFTPLANGVAETNDQGQTHQRVIDVVLHQTKDGWVLADLGGITPAQEAAIASPSANKFKGAC